jgi:hypothetical protein
MHTDAPASPRFETDLEAILRREAARKRRVRRPYAPASFRRLRNLSSAASHVGAAVAVSTTLLILSPATLDREVQLPPIAEPPAAGYLAQYGAAGGSTADATIAMAREAGFEVEVITTYVADRAADGQILTMRHLSETVDTLPVHEPARGPLLIIIGLTVGDAGGNTAN